MWYDLLRETSFVCVVSGIVYVESTDSRFTGGYEPPIGGCARVMPHARPEPINLRVEAAPIVFEDSGAIDQLPIELNDIPLPVPTPRTRACCRVPSASSDWRDRWGGARRRREG